MNFLKKMALVASLALAGAGSAHASGTYLMMDSGAGGDFENTWSFDSGDFGVTGVKGKTFGDYFIFNVPDNEYVSFSAVGVGVTFKSPAKDPGTYGFALWGLGLDPFLVDAGGSTTAHSIEGGEWYLTSGDYELDLTGAYAKAGGTYDLLIAGSIPEPTNWALMMAGIGAVGMLARRRRSAQA